MYLQKVMFPKIKTIIERHVMVSLLRISNVLSSQVTRIRCSTMCPSLHLAPRTPGRRSVSGARLGWLSSLDGDGLTNPRDGLTKPGAHRPHSENTFYSLHSVLIFSFLQAS